MEHGDKAGDNRGLTRGAGDEAGNTRLGRAGDNGEQKQRRKDEAGKNPKVNFQEPKSYHMLPCAGESVHCLD